LLVLGRPLHILGSSMLELSPPRLAYDGPAHGRLLDAFWSAHAQTPLRYLVYAGPPLDPVAGSLTAFFSRFRPSVFELNDPRPATWIDMMELRARGGVVVSSVPIDPSRPVAGLCVAAAERFQRPTIHGGYRPTYLYFGYLPPS